MSERALFLWNNEYIAQLTCDYRQRVLPLIYPALKRNQSHWNETVRNLTANILKLFEETDTPFLVECADRYDKENNKTLSSQQSSRNNKWENLRKLAAEQEALLGLKNGVEEVKEPAKKPDDGAAVDAASSGSPEKSNKKSSSPKSSTSPKKSKSRSRSKSRNKKSDKKKSEKSEKKRANGDAQKQREDDGENVSKENDEALEPTD